MNYRFPRGVEIQLFPEGEVAAFLTVQRFFEKTELELVSAYLKPGMTVIDAGANIGVYSIFAEKLMNGAGAVWSFEPSLDSRAFSLAATASIDPTAAVIAYRGLADGRVDIRV